MGLKKATIKKHCYILTGGPGAGKTTVLEELEKRGFTCFPEIAREIIKEQLATGGSALPWQDTHQYKQLMVSRTIAQFKIEANSPTNLCFFDRGIVDLISYSKLINSPIEEDLHYAALYDRYNPLVFIFPPWKEIYKTDTERKQNFEEAILTYEILKQAYEEYEYKTIDVPFTEVRERADFILGTIFSS